MRRVNKYFEVSHSSMRLFYNMKSNMYKIFILKLISITNISIEHYMTVLLDNYNKIK